MSFEFDLCVIGGGSGGLAAAKTAADLGAKVCMLDFVKPSPNGTTWGLGGTCVNVGCIPKKLYHTAGIVGDAIEQAKDFGWKIFKEGKEFDRKKEGVHDWDKLRSNIVMHIRSLNFNYRGQMFEKEIEYKNSYGSFVDKHTVKCVDEDGEEEVVTAKYFILATGGRPKYPDIPGAKLAISSDDIFHLEKDPKKTLCIGASYIALETAGFLSAIGRDTTVMVRSIPLRGFDVECAEKIVDDLKNHGIKFLQPISPTSIKKTEDGKFEVEYVNNKTKEKGKEIYDTVLMAIGRDPCTKGIGLEKIGVKLDKKGKVIVDDFERSSVDNVFAVGDIINHQELTPVAIQTGQLLAKRLFAGSKKKMDYTKVPTTVFTPLEYGSCGFSQEEAEVELGKPFISIFTSNKNVLEYSLSEHFKDRQCFFKIITYKFDEDRIVGFHYLGPNAGEVTQAMSLAMKCGAKKEDLDLNIGIHPTNAEVMTTMYEQETKDKGC